MAARSDELNEKITRRRSVESRTEWNAHDFLRSKIFVFLFVASIIGVILALNLDDVIQLGCSLAGENEDHCIKAIAIGFNSETICNHIRGKEFMTEIGGKEVQLENPPKMECITEIAAERDNPALCSKVEGVIIANTKIDCLYRVAARNRDPEACGMIGNEEQSRMGMQMNKQNCLAMMKLK